MEIKSLPVQNEDGDLVPGSSATIYHMDSGDVATIYDRDGAVISNPITAGADGIIEFAAENGPYRVMLTIGIQQYERFLYFSDIQEHNHSPSAHPELSAFITSEADRAEQAADAAALNAGIYADTAAGLSATTEGDYFSVPSSEDDEYLILYRHEAGPVATEIKRYPSAEAVGDLADTVADTAGRLLDAGVEYIDADIDLRGNVARALLADGTNQMAKVSIGSDPDNNTLTEDGAGLALKADALTFNESYRTVVVEIVSGKFAGAAFIDADAAGYVVSATYANGAVETTDSGSAPNTAVLLSATTLPDGVQGQNPNGGFTCTGLDRDSAGLWIVGNDGRATEESSVFDCSVVILHPDFRQVFAEIPCNTADFAGIKSIQGVAWDSSDNTIWFVDKTNKTLRHITRDGTKLLDEIVVTHTPNGLAYDSINDALWSPGEGTTDCYLFSCADGSLLRTIPIAADCDQLTHVASSDRIYYTTGGNGNDGTVTVISAQDGEVIGSFTNLERSQAIEGVYVDAEKRRMYVLNDGAFHVAANPPLALACEYSISL